MPSLHLLQRNAGWLVGTVLGISSEVHLDLIQRSLLGRRSNLQIIHGITTTVRRLRATTHVGHDIDGVSIHLLTAGEVRQTVGEAQLLVDIIQQRIGTNSQSAGMQLGNLHCSRSHRTLGNTRISLVTTRLNSDRVDELITVSYVLIRVELIANRGGIVQINTITISRDTCDSPLKRRGAILIGGNLRVINLAASDNTRVRSGLSICTAYSCTTGKVGQALRKCISEVHIRVIEGRGRTLLRTCLSINHPINSTLILIEVEHCLGLASVILLSNTLADPRFFRYQMQGITPSIITLTRTFNQSAIFSILSRIVRVVTLLCQWSELLMANTLLIVDVEWVLLISPSLPLLICTVIRIKTTQLSQIPTMPDNRDTSNLRSTVDLIRVGRHQNVRLIESRSQVQRHGCRCSLKNTHDGTVLLSLLISTIIGQRVNISTGLLVTTLPVLAILLNSVPHQTLRF